MGDAMERTDIAVVGGGPAGLCAAIAAADAGARVTLFDRGSRLGGQLVKQTHKFFGSAGQHASVRGIDIAALRAEALDRRGRVDIRLDSTVIGLYGDRVLTYERGKTYHKIQPRAIIVAAGASEKFLPFPNNDLPGIYGAGAVQTLMNLYGVIPGQKAVMLGAGNIGLIVSYQLIQAGVDVRCVVEGSPRIGGYEVHAAKIRRMGVPIHTSTSVARAYGTDRLERVTLCGIDSTWKPIRGSEFDVDTDLLCVAVGLSPLTELLWQTGCAMRYIPELGGHVPLRNDRLETSLAGIFVAGDAAGIEEASSAMVEGKLAGLCAAESLGYGTDLFPELRRECLGELASLRGGPMGEKIRRGLAKAALMPTGTPTESAAADSAAPTPDAAENSAPSAERLSKGPLAVVECFQRIPCDPCARACKRGAIAPFQDINDPPSIDYDRCNGCGNCVSVCPGCAIFIVDETFSGTETLVSIPYEFVPLPEPGDRVTGLDRDGKPVTAARVISVRNRRFQDRTPVVSLAVPKGLGFTVRHIRPGDFIDDDAVVCRCEEITLGEIRKLISEGFTSLDEIKRISRCGMGPCQGRTCRHIVMGEIASATGIPIYVLPMTTFRPPAKSIELGALAAEWEEGHAQEAPMNSGTEAETE